uniref:Elongation of very long chain fatty acids protein n=1 Tax=Clastoptera arizonana TaxID=38151 RepID=A0A1B6CQ89_9HEMI
MKVNQWHLNANSDDFMESKKMSTLIKPIIDIYYRLNYDLTDPRTKDWFLISNPFSLLTLLIIYHYSVHSFLPRLMANKKPLNLDMVLFVYNIFQIVASTYLFTQSVILGWGGTYNWFCQPVDYSSSPHAMKVAKIMYLYFVVKFLDLLDTVFFVLRKKRSQVSFLHLYHHTVMVVLAWSAVKWIPGGHDTFVGFLNCFVHIIMYSYYLLSALRPEYKNVWWKRYITQLQMAQFLLIIIHSGILLLQPNCDYPKFTVGIFVPQNSFMFILFYDFYKNSYKKKVT